MDFKRGTNSLVQRQNVPRDGPSIEEILLNFLSNPFQYAIDMNALKAAVAMSLSITALLTLLFSFVRPRHTLVYAPKTKHADEKHACPPIGKGFWAWIGPVSKAKESELVDKIGMDAVLFLRFTKMLRNIFVILGFIGLVIMIPVNVACGNKSITGSAGAFAIMTPLYVFNDGLWAQVVCAWVFDIIVVYFLWSNYREILDLRRAYLESSEYQNSLHARTLIIRHIPSKIRSDQGLLQITDEVNSTGVPPRTAIGRNMKILPELIEEHEENVKKLESVLSKYLQNPDHLPQYRPTMKTPKSYKGEQVQGKVDTIEYLTDRIRDLEQEIKEVREKIDKRDPLSYGFASWEHISQAHAVAYAARKKHPQGTSIQLAPRPNDLIWNNLPLSKAAQKRKRLANIFWIAILTLLWTPLNAVIAVLSHLSLLGNLWPAFGIQLGLHPISWGIFQGIAAPAITSGLYLILPIIFRRLQIRAGDVTKTSREHHVLRNLYLFFILNNLVVFSLFAAIWQCVTALIQAKKEGNSDVDYLATQVLLIITTALCQVSPFWVLWLLQRNLGAAIDLAQLWSLTYVWFAKTFMAPTPRQNIEWTAPPPFDYASYYNYFLFYATVALCFSTLQPVVLLVTALYFSIDSFLKKYLLMYVFVTKNESGGMFWRTLFNRLLFGLFLSNIIIGIAASARGSIQKAYAIIPALILLIAFKWYCSKTFDDDIHYYTRGGQQDQERLAGSDTARRVDLMKSKLGHPALYKPLMTPMVHAKARHALGRIYRGRMYSEGGASTTFSDTVMEPMDESGHEEQQAPFEIVPEAQQDFTYYRDRSDFRDDAGEIYSRTEDQLVGDGGPTPRSAMDSNFEYSLPNSRAPSPSPDRGPRIPRKAVNERNVHPAFRSGTSTRSTSAKGLDTSVSDLGIGHSPYTDQYDSSTNLLQSAGARTPNRDLFSPLSPLVPGGHGRAISEADVGTHDIFKGTK